LQNAINDLEGYEAHVLAELLSWLDDLRQSGSRL
jgi:hypothetical protein